MHEIMTDFTIKEKCQTFTPENIVSTLLDNANYCCNLYGQKVLENSCGNGAIISQIVERYIVDCQLNGLDCDTIKNGLENDVYAFDVDDECIKTTIEKLDRIAIDFGLSNVKWNVFCKDFLDEKIDAKFSYIIGNPPYISYADLPVSIRDFVKNNFVTCNKGKFDYSYAFIEKSYNHLTTKGVLVYIIPSNIFKNVFAKDLREYIKSDVVKIIDYSYEKVFDSVLVSPAIMCVEKNSDSSKLEYCINDSSKIIDKSLLKDKWCFDSLDDRVADTIGNHYKISSTVATLYNKAFVLFDLIENNEYYVTLNGDFIEKDIVKKAASPKNKKYNKCKEYIIFPYYFENDKINHYTESQFEEKFPYATKYLKMFEEELKNRTKDSNALWFEYGRSQAIRHMNQKKIMISSVISDCTVGYLLSEDEIPYSGLYIVPKGNESLDSLIDVLNSDDFKRHIKNVGVCASGTSRRITPSDIAEYYYEE